MQKVIDFLKRHWAIWIILAAALVISMPFIHPEPLTGHDAPFHMFRYQGIANAWASGQLVPQLDPAAFGGFGYAPSLFYGPLTGWVVLFFTWLVGGHAYIAVNLLMILSIFGAALACYKLVREITGKATPAVLAAVAYAAAPYHLLDYFVRRADGEMLPFIFAPLVFLGLWRLLQKSPKNAILPLVIGGAGMVLSHNLSALLWASLALIFVAINWRGFFAKQSWKFTLPKFVYSAALILLLSAVFILPMLEASNAALYNIMNPVFAETNMGQNAEAVWRRGIHPGELFFDTPINYDLFYGLGLIAFLGVAAFAFARQNMPAKVRTFTRQMMIFGLVAAFMTTAWFFPWQWVPRFLTSIQFPWRLLTISSFGLAITAGISLYWLAHEKLAERRTERPSLMAAGAILILAAVAPLMSLGMYHPRWDYWYDYRLSSLVVNENRIWWYGAEYEYLPARVMGCEHRHQCPLKEEMPEWLLDRHAAGIVRHDGYLEYPLFFYPAYEARTESGEELEVFESPNGLVAVKFANDQELTTSQRELPFVYGITVDTVDGIEVVYGTSRATAVGFALSAFGLASLITYSILHYRTSKRKA
ncbi:YfhO family protein [Candidatus Saccharibacteria bacterium]|nr:YfhO family protein [Candidatus Saccharibacteria bacterium]